MRQPRLPLGLLCRSRNQQGHWCDMAVCGNRIKNRKLRARRR
ncbi:MAG: CGNR zinc finger domain-containing protein [Solirubrobacterales bacterium]|nr:CGNR zinc finger domain-containing protein [Solirubrobacterales bacterium]